MKHFCIYRSHRQVRRYVVLVFAVTVLSVFTPLSQKANAQSTHTPWQNLTQSKLTEVWWQWLYSIPASKSPVIDPTGDNAYSGQPYSDLLFLTGTYIVQPLSSGDVQGKAERSIKVKQGTTLFFPLINGEWDNTCGRPSLGGNCFGSEVFPNVLGVPALKAAAANAVNTADGLNATLTPSSGIAAALPFFRLQSSPLSYKLPASDNLYQYQGLDIKGTVAPSVADGYFSLVPGILALGEYTLEFGGKLPINDQGNYFIEKITYHITVIQ